jgi:hypothetical protein
VGRWEGFRGGLGAVLKHTNCISFETWSQAKSIDQLILFVVRNSSHEKTPAPTTRVPLLRCGGLPLATRNASGVEQVSPYVSGNKNYERLPSRINEGKTPDTSSARDGGTLDCLGAVVPVKTTCCYSCNQS